MFGFEKQNHKKISYFLRIHLIINVSHSWSIRYIFCVNPWKSVNMLFAHIKYTHTELTFISDVPIQMKILYIFLCRYVWKYFEWSDEKGKFLFVQIFSGFYYMCRCGTCGIESRNDILYWKWYYHIFEFIQAFLSTYVHLHGLSYK